MRLMKILALFYIGIVVSGSYSHCAEFTKSGCWEFSTDFNTNYESISKENSYFVFYPNIGLFVFDDYQLEMKLNLLCRGTLLDIRTDYSWHFFQFNYFFFEHSKRHFYLDVIYDNELKGAGIGSGMKIPLEGNRIIDLELQFLKHPDSYTVGRFTVSKNIFK